MTTKLLRPWAGPLEVARHAGSVNDKTKPLAGKPKPHVVHVKRLIPHTERMELENPVTSEISLFLNPPMAEPTSPSPNVDRLPNKMGNVLRNSDSTEGSEDKGYSLRRSARLRRPPNWLVDRQ